MSTPPPLCIEHRVRISVLEKECLWSLQGDILWKKTEGFPDFPIPLSSLSTLRLSFAPTRMQRNRYQCRLYSAANCIATIQNEHFAGFATFEDRSDSYRELVTAVVRRLAQVNPACEMVSGTTFLSWSLQCAFMIAMLGLLLVVLFLMWTAVGWLVIVKLLILAFYVPTAIRWVAKNKPRSFNGALVPENLLPR